MFTVNNSVLNTPSINLPVMPDIVDSSISEFISCSLPSVSNIFQAAIVLPSTWHVIFLCVLIGTQYSGPVRAISTKVPISNKWECVRISLQFIKMLQKWCSNSHKSWKKKKKIQETREKPSPFVLKHTTSTGSLSIWPILIHASNQWWITWQVKSESHRRSYNLFKIWIEST